MTRVGFEPTKLAQEILSLSPLTARESCHMLQPGIGPGSTAWKAVMLPLHHCSKTLTVGIEPTREITLG
jgi:hypothetical protein